MLLGYGAGAAGLLALLLALLLTGILLTVGLALRFCPLRPPATAALWGGYLLASALAVYPVACALMLIGMAIQTSRASGRKIVGINAAT